MMPLPKRTRQVNITLSDQEYEALQHLVGWRELSAADVVRWLITREAEVSRRLSPLQVDTTLATACYKKR